MFWLKSGIITRQVSKTWLVYLGDVPTLPLPVVVQVHHAQVRTGRGAPRWLPLKIVIFQMLPPIQHIWLFSPLFLISFLFHVHSRPSKWRSRLERNALNWNLGLWGIFRCTWYWAYTMLVLFHDISHTELTRYWMQGKTLLTTSSIYYRNHFQ